MDKENEINYRNPRRLGVDENKDNEKKNQETSSVHYYLEIRKTFVIQIKECSRTIFVLCIERMKIMPLNVTEKSN